jgi:hypothetical protein
VGRGPSKDAFHPHLLPRCALHRQKVDGQHASTPRGARSRSLSCFIAWFRDTTAHLQALCERQCPPRQGCSCERPAPMCVPMMGTEGLEALESLHSLSCPRTQHGTHPPWTTGYRRIRQGQPATGRRWLQTRSACKGNVDRHRVTPILALRHGQVAGLVEAASGRGSGHGSRFRERVCLDPGSESEAARAHSRATQRSRAPIARTRDSSFRVRGRELFSAKEKRRIELCHRNAIKHNTTHRNHFGSSARHSTKA